MEDTFFSKCSHHCGYTYFYNIAYNAAMLRLYKYIGEESGGAMYRWIRDLYMALYLIDSCI